MRYPTRMLLLIVACGIAQPAFAYVGPGAGLSLLGALWGLLLAVGAALLFLLMWPLRRLRKRHREQAQAQVAEETSGQQPPGSGTESSAPPSGEDHASSQGSGN